MRREKEYKYRVLVYPNITKKYNEIMKDSYIVLLPKVIKAITKINPQVHFTILNPIHLKEFDEIHFFGDKTFEGGNDYEIFTSERT